jgi:polysaccharide pyruvyl transferase WcaK-like protein
MFCFDGYRFARGFRFLVVGLGGVFDEAWGGKWRDLYSIFRWTVLARLARTPVLCLSVGVEEVHTTLGKFFCKTALSLAKYRSFRDEESKKKVEEMGVRGENRIFPDLAFGLDLQKSTARQEKNKVIGVSPMAYYDPRFWPVQDVSAYQAYLKRLASFVSWLLRNGYDVVLFPTQIRMDRTAIEELRASVLEEVPVSLHDRLTDSKLRTVEECLALLSQLAMVVTSRLHGVILSFLAGTPVLAISPANKIDSLMEDMELTEYVLSIREIELPSLVDRFQKLDGNRDIMKNRLQQKVAEYRLAVEAQFDIVFSSEGFLDATEPRLDGRY